MNNFIDLSFDEAWSCLSPHVNSKINFNELSNMITKRTYKECLKKILGYHQIKRTEKNVKIMYNDKWISNDSISVVTERGYVGVEWNSSKFVVGGLGLRKLQTLRIMKLIEKIKPKSVLDVGCGNGERLLQLACMYPEVKFTGLELTPGGVETAKNMQKFDQISEALSNASPQPLTDLTAHKSIKFVCASAKNIPFDDNSFDLVYTSLALEQMEMVREYALKEIYRVTNQYSSFYEAFKDYNNKLPQLAYIYSQDYFKASLKDLTSHGYTIVEVIDQIPQKTYMNAVFVIAKK
jgi:ubiquinone/menaquinone biosynthesis C-methylase UbiE